MFESGPPASLDARSTICWSAKGGSGTTVITAALGLCVPTPTVLVDLAGDLPAALGLTDPAGPGINDWIRSDAPAEHLEELAIRATEAMTVIPQGIAAPDGDLERWDLAFQALTAGDRRLVIDAGTGGTWPAVHELADRSVLVIRACYLALRRALAAPVRAQQIVLVAEPGRALRAQDVEQAVGAPVIATVHIDPAVARAVDAGLLTARLPRVLARELHGAA